MLIRIEEQRNLENLLVFLREIGCQAARVGDTMLELHLRDTLSESAERLELSVYLDSWQERHLDAPVEIVG